MVRSFPRVIVILAFCVVMVLPVTSLAVLMKGLVMGLAFCVGMRCRLLSLKAGLVLAHGLLRLFLRSCVLHCVISF